MRTVAALLLLTTPCFAGPLTEKELTDGITVSGSTYRIHRALYDRLTKEPELVVKSLRLVPARDGHGFKVFAVRSDNLPGRLGLRNDDTLVSLDDHPLDSPQATLDALESMRKPAAWTLVISRAGENKTLRWIVK